MFNIQTVSLVRPRFECICLVVTAVILLTGLTPPNLFADESNVPALTPRAQKVLAQAAKTPEEVFMLINALRKHPNTDAYDFVEKLSGIDRSYWRVNFTGKGILPSPKDDEMKWTSFLWLAPREMRNLFNRPVRRPHRTYKVLITDKERHLYGVSIYYGKNPSPPTAEDVRKVFGVGRVRVFRPGIEGVSGDKFAVHHYYSSGKYSISFRFVSKRKIQYKYQDNDDFRKRLEGMEEVCDRIKPFEAHKDFLLININIKRIKI